MLTSTNGNKFALCFWPYEIIKKLLNSVSENDYILLIISKIKCHVSGLRVESLVCELVKCMVFITVIVHIRLCIV